MPKITYYNGSTDAYSGQVNMEAAIYIDGQIIGAVEYVLYDGELSVSHIYIKPEYRRQGYGSRLMKFIQQENPEYKYVPSMKTPEGAAFKHKDLPLESKFVSFDNWLNESPHQLPMNEPRYGCVMMDADIKNWEQFHLSGIEEDDIYLKPYDDSYGLEETPHVTIVYGIHEDEVDPQRMADLIEHYMKPLTVTIKEIGIFEGKEYDVVKYNVPVTGQLQGYRDIFMQIPNTQNFPEYHPHMTIAYVKPGTGKKYKTELRDPFGVTFTKGVYSWHPSKDKDPDKTSRKVVNLVKKEAPKEDALPPNIQK